MLQIDQPEFIKKIKAKLESRPHNPKYTHYNTAPEEISSSAYSLILGAGFSYGVIPLVKELMEETIGDYYYPDPDMSSMKRPSSVLKKDSANFWKEFNATAKNHNLPIVARDGKGMPYFSGEAYQNLFNFSVANKLFKLEKPKKSFLTRPPTSQEENQGEKFVRGFLQHILSPGSEAGYGATGRIELNVAHIYLAALLEAQQLGRNWNTAGFCRTILTTNFDTLLQNALQMFNLLYRLTDRPEKGFEYSDLISEQGPMHLVYVHGSILRYNPASSVDELGKLAERNKEVLKKYLELNDIIVIGYGGWKDVLMEALKECNSNGHVIYWCDIQPEPSEQVAELLENRPQESAYYIQLKDGASDLMKSLYDELVTEPPSIDPMEKYRKWSAYVHDRKFFD